MNPSVAGTLAARARAVIPGGVNSGQRQIPGLEDLVVVRTEGCTFEDSLIASTEIAVRSVLAGRAQPGPAASR